jgi:hypothetical protein
MSAAEALDFAGPPGAAPHVVGQFPIYQRERACDDQTGQCEPWEAPTLVPGPFSASFYSYEEWGPTTRVRFSATSSGVGVECDGVGLGCTSEGRSIVGTVGRHCVWLLQEAPLDGKQVQWVVTGTY